MPFMDSSDHPVSPAIRQMVKEAYSDCAIIANAPMMQTPDLCLELLFDDQYFGSHEYY